MNTSAKIGIKICGINKGENQWHVLTHIANHKTIVPVTHVNAHQPNNAAAPNIPHQQNTIVKINL